MSGKQRSSRILWLVVGPIALFLAGKIYFRCVTNALVDAVREGRTADVRRCLTLGADPNVTIMPAPGYPLTSLLATAFDKLAFIQGGGPSGRANLSSSRLRVSASQGKQAAAEIICLLVEHHARIRSQTHGDFPYLTIACQEGSLKMVRCLLEHGADVTEIGKSHVTALDAAVSQVAEARRPSQPARRTSHGAGEQSLLSPQERADREAILQLLLARGLHLNLAQAATLNDVGAVRAFLDVGSPPNAKALLTAVQANYVDIVRLLVERGADVNTTDTNYGPLVAIAARNGYSALVQYLLKQGASVHTSSPNRPLLADVIRGTPDLTGEFLRRGADVHAGYEQALRTALQTDRPLVVKQLLQQRADVNAKPPAPRVISQNDVEAPTLLRVAVEHAPECVPMLIKARVRIRPDNADILFPTLQRKRYALVPLLVQAGTDVNIFNAFGDTPLSAAIGEDNAIVQYLLQHGANPNTLSQSERTPLGKAAAIGDALCVALLVQYHVAVDTHPPHGHTALYYARKYKHEDVAKMLEVAGAKDAN